MRNDLRVLGVFVWLACLATTAHAQGVAAPPLKVGIIRIQQVFQNYTFAIEQEKAIKEGFQQQQDEINALGEQIKKEKDALVADTTTDRNSAVWQEKILKIQILEVRLKDKLERFQKMSRHARAEYYRSIYADFRRAVDTIAKRDQFDIIITAPDTELSKEVLENDSPMAIQNEILMRQMQFISPRVDITQAVTDQMNAFHAARSGKGAGGGKK